MAIYDRICRTCGTNFKGGPRAWYCPDCRHEREKERARKYKQGPAKRPIGSIDICENCGEEYKVASGLQKYCPKCQPAMHKKVDNEQGTEYYHKIVAKDKKLRSKKRRAHYAKNKDEINKKRREKTRVEPSQTKANIKELRAASGMTQKEFANYFHIAISTIASWEQKGCTHKWAIELIEYKLKQEGLI